MKFRQTPFINLEGDFDEAKTLIPRALRELDLLDGLMAFQKLDQGTRVVNFDTGAQISLRQTFGVTNISIYSPEIVEEIVVEEIQNAYLFKLYTEDYEGNKVPVNTTTLKYFALYPVGSTDYNKTGVDDVNQPAYLYDPETMFRRDIDGFIDVTEWGANADLEPVVSSNGVVIIRTDQIRNYAPGMAYWASYALYYLPCTYITQYPNKVLSIDKWKEENLLLPGFYEDKVEVGVFIGYEVNDSTHKYYIFFDMLAKTNEDPPNPLYEPRCFWSLDKSEIFPSDITPSTEGIWLFDYRDLTADEIVYVDKVLHDMKVFITDSYPTKLYQGTGGYTQQCSSIHEAIPITDVYITPVLYGDTEIPAGSFDEITNQGPQVGTPGGLGCLYTDIDRLSVTNCGGKVWCTEHNILLSHKITSDYDYYNEYTRPGCFLYTGMYFLSEITENLDEERIENEIVTPLGIIPALTINTLMSSQWNATYTCIEDFPVLTDCNGSYDYSRDIVNPGWATLGAGKNTITGNWIYLIRHDKYIEHQEVNYTGDVDRTTYSFGLQMMTPHIPSLPDPIYDHSETFGKVGVSNLINSKYVDVIVDDTASDWFKKLLVAHLNTFLSVDDITSVLWWNSFTIGVGADHGI